MTRSIPLAVSSLCITVPLSRLKLSCKPRCWNSKPNFQTSPSSNCRLEPVRIRGAIHETVMNCHKLKLSSGLRSDAVASVKGLLIEHEGREGSRRGIMRMIRTASTLKVRVVMSRPFSVLVQWS